MTMIVKHKDVLRPDTLAHLARATVTSHRPKALHTHDFYELFWVQNGVVRHHTDTGIARLVEGDLILLSPKQKHAVQGKGDHAMIVSVCIHPDVVNGLQKRHLNIWPKANAPRLAHRDIKQLAALNHAAKALEHSRLDILATEAFLLPLLSDLQNAPTPDGTPEWLNRGMAAAQNPEVFREGAAGLVAQTGRAHAHVSRSMRKHTGLSPSEYVNSVRMNYAARALVTDNEPVNQIALDCGIPNMAHFHKLFRAQTGMTPLQYRQQFQRNVIQPT